MHVGSAGVGDGLDAGDAGEGSGKGHAQVTPGHKLPTGRSDLLRANSLWVKKYL